MLGCPGIPAGVQDAARPGCAAQLPRARSCARCLTRWASCCSRGGAVVRPAGRTRCLDRRAAARRCAGRRGRLRRALRPRPRHRAAPVRACARRLARPRPGDDRPRPDLREAGLSWPGELPDYLPVVLEFASTQPPREARAFLGEIAHILNVIFSALQQRGSAYASVLGALLELAGEKAQAVKITAEEPLDESWAEPVAFDGCSTKGQARPGQPQPIRGRSQEPIHRSGRMNPVMTYLHNFLFNVYPYICLAVFFMGSLARFDRDQYTWKSDSSQLLRAGTAALGQQPVPRRHPVPVLRPPVRPADAALALRALHHRAAEAVAGDRARAARPAWSASSA